MSTKLLSVRPCFATRHYTKDSLPKFILPQNEALQMFTPYTFTHEQKHRPLYEGPYSQEFLNSQKQTNLSMINPFIIS